jgi:cytochrome P450
LPPAIPRRLDVIADDRLKPETIGGGGPAGDAVIVSSLADARFLLSSPGARFVREGPAEATVAASPLETFIARGRALTGLWMWGRPPETHRRLRKAAAEAVGARVVASRLEAIRGHAAALLAAAEARDGIDLVGDYARPLVRDALLDLFGIPPARRSQLEEHLKAMGDFLKGGGHDIGPGHYFAVAATGQLVGEPWRAALPPEARAGRVLVAAVEAGELSFDEAIAQAVLLLLGNSYTTADALCGLLARLSERPDLWAAARQGELALEALVEEGLRLGPPTHMVLLRRATSDLACPSGTIEAGSQIVLPLTRINRDPAAFPDPDRFDPTRTGGRHVAFGAGRHLCTGVHLARATLRAGLEALLHALPRWPADVERRYGASLLGGTSVTALRVGGGAIRCG